MTNNENIQDPPDGDGLQADYSERILVEQLRSLNRFLPPILGVNLLVGSALIYALWDMVSRQVLFYWATALVVMLLIRVAPYVYYRWSADSHISKRHRGYFVFGSAMSGLLWGAAGVVLFPQNLEYQLFIITILIGMGAGAVSSLTAYMPAFYVYLPASLLPVTVNLFIIGGSMRISLGLMILTYIAALSFFAQTINRSLAQTLRLGFQNRELISNLLEAKDRAESATLVKTKFLAAASHDLRQPLHALGLFVDMLDARTQLPGMRGIVDNIKLSTDSLKGLLDSLLDISKLDAQVLKPEVSNVKLQMLLDQLALEFGPQAAKKGLMLRIRPCDAWVLSDPVMLARILRNLLANAVRYTPAGGVLLGCRRLHGMIRIEVYDTGRGILSGQIDKIFDEFYQIDNPERDRNKGLGLGLAIVRRLADLMQHKMDVRSQPGKGTVFSVSVPETGAAPRPDAQTQIYQADLAGALVVVIDDEAPIRVAMGEILKDWGCRTVLAESGDSAMEQLTNDHLVPDLIVADYRLREGTTGAQAIRQITASLGCEIPAIIVTGDIAPERLREAKESRYPVLHKPVSAASLRSLASYVVEKARPTAVSTPASRADRD